MDTSTCCVTFAATPDFCLPGPCQHLLEPKATLKAVAGHSEDQDSSLPVSKTQEKPRKDAQCTKYATHFCFPTPAQVVAHIYP